jgi:hypothetical protein
MKEDERVCEESCYHFENIITQNGLLDKCIDATYIIFLEGNEERKSNIKNQLEKLQPSKKIHILNNKGFKKCKKNLKEQTPKCDLIDCFVKVFNDAEEKGYNNILILEDDFIFNEKIKNPIVINEISDFINNESERNSNFIYLLGCVPYLQIPSLFFKNKRVLITTGTHASIYSKKFRSNLLMLKQENINDWDIYTNFECPNTFRYMYKEPLCYQLFYETENFNSWDDSYNLKYVMMNIFKALHMDKNPEPGFSFFYLLSEILFFVILFVFYFGFKFVIEIFVSIFFLFINQLNFILSLFINKS